MKRERIVQNVTIIVLAVALVVMSVGYAAYSQTLTINGTATVKAANWDIHFANIDTTKSATGLTNGGAVTTAPTIDEAKTTVTWGASLALNDTYTFNVDIVNGGTFNANLGSYTLAVKTATGTAGEAGAITCGAYSDVTSGITNATYKNDYLTYKVEYSAVQLNTVTTKLITYSAIAANDALAAASYRTAKVTVSYTQPTDAANLPSTPVCYQFTLTMNYTQA